MPFPPAEPGAALSARRRFICDGARAVALAGLPWVATGARGAELQLSAPFEQGKWSPRNHAILGAFLALYGSRGAGYDPKRRPYAVFDWDNTAIMNDAQEALFMYQITSLSFRLAPPEFATALRQGVPAGPFAPSRKNAAGQGLALDAITADLESDYAWLHARYERMKGIMSLEAIHDSPQYQDFRAKLYYLFDAIGETHGAEVAHRWVVCFFANQTPEEVSALAERSIDFNLGLGLTKMNYASPASLPGRSGVVGATHFHGIRLTTEIASLMDALRREGIDVYVCTASLEQVAGVFASLPKYGYNVPRANVFGLRLEMAGKQYAPRLKSDWPITWGPGKTAAIRRELVVKKGQGPILVAGDNDGDYDMLRDFADTKLSLIVNRLKRGKIGELAKRAAEMMETANSRYLLQGRQESTGIWLPSEQTLAYGNSAARLLA